MPRGRRNPANDMPTTTAPLEPVTLTPTQELPIETTPTQNPYQGVNLTLPLNLPEGFTVNLPDISQLANSAVGDASTGFAPNPNLPRVSDSDREVHAVIFREQVNAALNLKDSITVANTYVDAAVEGTKLGKNLVRYATGLEGIREQQVKLQQAQTKTAIAGEQLKGLQHELNFLTSENVHRLETFNSKLDQWREKVRAEQLKTSELTHQIDTRYAHLIQAQA